MSWHRSCVGEKPTNINIQKNSIAMAPTFPTTFNISIWSNYLIKIQTTSQIKYLITYIEKSKAQRVNFLDLGVAPVPVTALSFFNFFSLLKKQHLKICPELTWGVDAQALCLAGGHAQCGGRGRVWGGRGSCTAGRQPGVAASAVQPSWHVVQRWK